MRARPMVRTIVGVVITLVCFAVDHALGLASAVVTGVWVLLGVGSVIRAATDKPSEHHYARAVVMRSRSTMPANS